MKLFALLPLALGLCAAQVHAADKTVVFGDRYTFTERDFSFTPGVPNPAFPEWGEMRSKEYVAEFDVRGDNGQTLLFDFDIDVWGHGHQRTVQLCPYYKDGKWLYQEMPPLGGICVIGSKPAPAKEFRFSVSANLTCSGMDVGVDSDARIETLSDYIKVTNTYRGVRLRIDKEGVYNSQCKTMKLVLKPGLNMTIDQIDADLFFGSPF